MARRHRDVVVIGTSAGGLDAGVTLRMLEERRHQLLQMLRHERGSWGKRHYSNQAKETETNIKRIREMLLAPERGGA